MSKNVFVSIWPVNTLDTTINHSLRQKIDDINQAIDDAYTFLMGVAARMRINKPHMIFAAPEYYFIGGKAGVPGFGGTGVTFQLYDEDEKKQIYRELKAISNRHKRMLIVPGTVYWEKPRKTPGGSRLDRTKDAINVAPMFYNGSVKFEYEKKFDDESARLNTTDCVFRAGTGSQTFKWESMQVGIEVCGDFEESRLANSTTKELDLEVYISATNPHGFTSGFMNRIPVKDGGYLIHCDASGEDIKNGVYLVNRGCGSHGVTLEIESHRGIIVRDPFTGEVVSAGHTMQQGPYAQYGVTGTQLSLSKVFKITLDPNGRARVNVAGIAAPVPVTTAPRRGSLSLPREAVLPRLERRGSFSSFPGVSRMSGDYTFQITDVVPVAPGVANLPFRAKVVLSMMGTGAGVAQSLSGAVITFATDQGVINPASVMTNHLGAAETTLTLNDLSHPVNITARYQGAVSTIQVELVDLGAGNVSRMGPLFGNPHNDELPSWHLLV